MLIGKIDTQPNGLMASEAKVEGKTVAEKLRGFVRHVGRDRSYYDRVLNVQNISEFEDLSVSEAQDTARLIAEPRRLKDAETVQGGQDDLPF